MYKRIVVPLDGSEVAEAVLGHVQGIALCAGSEVVLLRVAVHPVYEYLATDPLVAIEVHETTDTEVRTYLEGIAAGLRAQGVQVRTECAEGPIAPTICALSDQLGADLIAMSTHGRSGITRWVIGSVADQVVRQSKVPVLLIRPKGV